MAGGDDIRDILNNISARGVAAVAPPPADDANLLVKLGKFASRNLPVQHQFFPPQAPYVVPTAANADSEGATDVAELQARFAQLARQTINPGQTPPAAPVDLSTLLQTVPLGSGFWTRLATDTLTDEDRLAAAPSIGGTLDRPAEDAIIRQLMSTYKMPNIRPPASQGSAAQGWQAFMPTGQSPFGAQPFGGSRLGRIAAAPANAAFGALGAVGPAVAGVANWLGQNPDDLPPAPPDASGGAVNPPAQTGGVAPGAPPPPSGGGSPVSTVQVPSGFSTDAQGHTTVTGYTPTLQYTDPATGKKVTFGYAATDTNGNTTWKPAGDANDPVVRNAISTYGGLYGMSTTDIQATQNIPSETLATASAAQKAQIDAQNYAKQQDLAIQIAQGQLTVQQANAKYAEQVAKATADKADVDLELAKVNLALQPVIQKEHEVTIAKAQMDMQQSQQKFPYELQQLQSQTALYREQLLTAQRAQQQSAANDQFAQQVYPAMATALAPYLPVGTVPAGGGNQPPPIFSQLAAGAGVPPSSPAAQMAYGLLQQKVLGNAAQPPAAGDQNTAPTAFGNPLPPAPQAAAEVTPAADAAPTPEEMAAQQPAPAEEVAA